MGGTWRSEDLAGEAILQLDCLTVNDHLLGPGRRPVASAAISHILGKNKKETHEVHRRHTVFRVSL